MGKKLNTFMGMILVILVLTGWAMVFVLAKERYGTDPELLNRLPNSSMVLITTKLGDGFAKFDTDTIQVLDSAISAIDYCKYGNERLLKCTQELDVLANDTKACYSEIVGLRGTHVGVIADYAEATSEIDDGQCLDRARNLTSLLRKNGGDAIIVTGCWKGSPTCHSFVAIPFEPTTGTIIDISDFDSVYLKEWNRTLKHYGGSKDAMA